MVKARSNRRKDCTVEEKVLRSLNKIIHLMHQFITEKITTWEVKCGRSAKKIDKENKILPLLFHICCLGDDWRKRRRKCL